MNPAASRRRSAVDEAIERNSHEEGSQNNDLDDERGLHARMIPDRGRFSKRKSRHWVRS